MIVKSNLIGINHIWVCGHGLSGSNSDKIESGLYWAWPDETIICFDDGTPISVEK